MKTPIVKGYTPIDQRRLILPVLVGVVFLVSITLLTQIEADDVFTPTASLVSALWAACILYAVVFYWIVLPAPRLFDRLRWINTFIICAGIILVQFTLPQLHVQYFGIYLLLSITLNALLYGRWHVFFTFIALTGVNIFLRLQMGLTSLADWVGFLPITLASIILGETILRMQDSMKDHIRRLEIVNEFARRSAASLNTEDVLAALDLAIQQAISPDTYFAGILEDDVIRLLLFVDDGEYFASSEVKSEGTLSSWVIRNNRTLFVADLRIEPELEGVRMVQIGKEKLNLCWLGVPMKTPDLVGLLAIASYSPNAFDHNDIELIGNLAQHTAQALGNTFQHARVEEQSQLDSLTGVFNHGHFLKVLNVHAQNALQSREPLSLVMMDIDRFKQYNDLYGHLTGDNVLVSLCNIIRRYLKRNDAVGRWGGEEFVISLPGANGLQALSVCQRIQDAISQTAMQNLDGRPIPAPSISQGIAVFPDEAQEIMALIHLADKRLYVAKKRGRNQIEPSKTHWQQK